MLGGAIGDRYGRKGAMLLGLFIFTTFSLVAVFSNSTPMLIIARCLMGPGAALIMPATLSIIIVSFPIEERPKAIAIWAAFAGLGGSIGPISSGFLLEHFWWGSIFFINVIVCSVLIVIVAMLVPKMPRDTTHALDPVGSIVSIVALFSTVYAIIEGPVKGWTSREVLLAAIIGIVGIIVFIIFENATSNPMLDPKFFKIKGFSSGALAVALVFFALFGMFFLFIQYLQFVKGYSPLQAAVRLIPNSITFIVVAPISAILLKKIKVKKTVLIGFMFTSVGFFISSTYTTNTKYTTMVLGIVCIAAGMALLMPPCSQQIVGSLPKRKVGVGSAMNDLSREVGGATGIAVAGSILNSYYQSKDKFANSIGESVFKGKELLTKGAIDQNKFNHIIDTAHTSYVGGMRIAFLTLGCVLLIAGIVTYFYIPNELPN